ncbi:MAG: hypothetical protein IT355_05515 [Gemmatimonadaceae bacterium]|nr:hypothetical protein [Gemmatimonadaceae bacterium]
MRPEFSPAAAVLQLLARADALASTATAAIASGDEAQLAATLDERQAVIEAVETASRAVTAPPADLRATLLAAARQSLTLGLAARNSAALAREQVVAELATLDARQHASHEYQSGSAQATIDVVL